MIYTAQSYLNEAIIEEKRTKKDYHAKYAIFNDDGVDVNMLIDGHHSLEAAKRDNVSPILELTKNNFGKNYTLEQFVKSFNDLSNPVNIETGEELW